MLFIYNHSTILYFYIQGTIGTFNELITKLFKESKIKFNVKEPTTQFFETLK